MDAEPTHKSSATIYDAWQSTLAPFLMPAAVLSAWPVFMVVGASNRTPLKLLCVQALVSLADGLLGSCAYPLAHQYAFSPAQNDGLFYAGSMCYWLSGLICAPVLEGWGVRRSCAVLGAAGVLGALGAMQSVFVFALVGRCLCATATSCLSTAVEYVLYDEAQLRKAAVPVERDDVASDKEHAAPEVTAGLGGGMLTLFHQLHPLTLWASTLLGQKAMAATATVSTGPCWAAALCFGVVLLIASFLLPTATIGEALRLAARRRTRGGLVGAGGEGERSVPVMLPSMNASKGGAGASMVQWWLGCATASYSVSFRTLVRPRLLARHLVDILFGGLFFVMSLLWVPTLEMYDDSVPFGFIFQIFMIAHFLGSTFSLPVWAVGWSEAGLVAVLSVTARVLNTSRDYAVPVTIMLAGVAMHLVAGMTQTTGSLWRAEYADSDAPLTFLFVVKALTGVSGWIFLNAIDGKYMESVFVFKARWMYVLMWVEAIALAQYIAKRTAQHRESASRPTGSSGGARFVSVRSKEDTTFDEASSSPYEVAASVGVDADSDGHIYQHHSHRAQNGVENRIFK